MIRESGVHELMAVRMTKLHDLQNARDRKSHRVKHDRDKLSDIIAKERRGKWHESDRHQEVGRLGGPELRMFAPGIPQPLGPARRQLG